MNEYPPPLLPSRMPVVVYPPLTHSSISTYLPRQVLELTAEEMDSLDEEELVEAMASIDVLIGELTKISKDSWNRVTASYSDLYLNRCYILAMRSRIPKVWNNTSVKE